MAKKKKNVVTDAVKEFKADNSDWKGMDQDDLYGELESYIDALLYEPEYSHYGYNEGESEDAELIIEKLVFKAVSKCQSGGRKHSCDPYYDDAFAGFDCMSKLQKYGR